MAQTNDEIKQKWHIGNKRENQLLKRFVLDNKMQGWVDSLIDGAIDEARLAALDDCKETLCKEFHQKAEEMEQNAINKKPIETGKDAGFVYLGGLLAITDDKLNGYWIGQMMAYDRAERYIEKALAELEALKRTFEKGSSNGGKEVLTRNADDKGCSFVIP